MKLINTRCEYGGLWVISQTTYPDTDHIFTGCKWGPGASTRMCDHILMFALQKKKQPRWRLAEETLLPFNLKQHLRAHEYNSCVRPVFV